MDTPWDKHRACPSCAGHHELSLPAPCFLSISWHKPEYGTRKLDQKDASGEISFSPPPPAGRDLGQCFLSGKGQAQRTAAKAELSARPAQTLPFYGNLATPSSHYAAPENFSFSLRFPTNKANDKAGDKHFTLCLHEKPGWAVPLLELRQTMSSARIPPSARTALPSQVRLHTLSAGSLGRLRSSQAFQTNAAQDLWVHWLQPFKRKTSSKEFDREMYHLVDCRERVCEEQGLYF